MYVHIGYGKHFVSLFVRIINIVLEINVIIQTILGSLNLYKKLLAGPHKNNFFPYILFIMVRKYIKQLF
jgi:hypothetical protein